MSQKEGVSLSAQLKCMVHSLLGSPWSPSPSCSLLDNGLVLCICLGHSLVWTKVRVAGAHTRDSPRDVRKAQYSQGSCVGVEAATDGSLEGWCTAKFPLALFWNEALAEITSITFGILANVTPCFHGKEGSLLGKSLTSHNKYPIHKLVFLHFLETWFKQLGVNTGTDFIQLRLWSSKLSCLKHWPQMNQNALVGETTSLKICTLYNFFPITVSFSSFSLNTGCLGLGLIMYPLPDGSTNVCSLVKLLF